MKRVSGQARRSRVTNSLTTAAACLAPSIWLGLRVARQHRLAAEHVQRQVAVVVVVGVELREFLLSVQRHIGSVDVEHQLGRRHPMCGDELRDQHFVQRPGLGTSGAVLEPAEGGRRSQWHIAADGGLHQHVATQRLVVVQILVAAAQAVHALREKLLQAVFDATGLAWIGQRSRRRAGQADVAIDLAQQHQAAVAAQLSAAEVGLDDAPPQASEIDLALRTLWHRQSSVVIGLEYL